MFMNHCVISTARRLQPFWNISTIQADYYWWLLSPVINCYWWPLLMATTPYHWQWLTFLAFKPVLDHCGLYRDHSYHKAWSFAYMAWCFWGPQNPTHLTHHTVQHCWCLLLTSELYADKETRDRHTYSCKHRIIRNHIPYKWFHILHIKTHMHYISCNTTPHIQSFTS